MKIECYLYIPYQGQFRFRFDTACPHGQQFAKSDGAYDNLLEVPAYTRDQTCKELKGSLYESIYGPVARTAIETHITWLLKTAPQTTKKIDLGAVTGMPDPGAKLWLSFARID